jgi:hypothetical protein
MLTLQCLTPCRPPHYVFMSSFQFSLSSNVSHNKISPKKISTFSVPMSTLRLKFESSLSFVLWLLSVDQHGFCLFCRYSKTGVACPPDVTLFAASFILLSASYRCFATGYYHPVVCESQNRTCFHNLFDDIGHCDQKQSYA